MHPDYTSQVTPQMPKTVVSASGQTESEGRQGARKEVRCSRREMHDEQGSQESGQREGEQDPASMTTPQLSRTSANAITLIEGSEEEHLGKGSGIGRERQYNDGETRKSEGKDLVSKAASWLPGFGAKSEGDGGHDLRKELKNLQAKLYSQERARKDDAAKMRALHDELAYERKTNAWLRDQKAGLESQWYQYVSAAEHDKRIRMKEAEDHQETKRLLEARTAEWRVAQEFLTTTDHLSASQISQEVADLNNEIFQTAALLVDRLECPQQQGIPPSGITDSKGAVESRFGSFLVQRLESADISDTTLIEGAYQAVMAEQARWIVETWYRDMTAQGQAIDLRWKELYRSIHRHEPQAIAGRWRSMTNRYIWGRYTELNDPRPFVSKLADHLAHVAFIAGRTDNWGQTRKIIREEFDSSLKDIVDFAFRLHRMVKQETTSCEMRIVYTKPDSEFDPVTMEDILHENPTPWNQRVSCTAALGLKRQVGGDAGKGAGRSETVLMKAKVLLQTSTEADDKMVTS